MRSDKYITDVRCLMFLSFQMTGFIAGLCREKFRFWQASKWISINKFEWVGSYRGLHCCMMGRMTYKSISFSASKWRRNFVSSAVDHFSGHAACFPDLSTLVCLVLPCVKLCTCVCRTIFGVTSVSNSFSVHVVNDFTLTSFLCWIYRREFFFH